MSCSNEKYIKNGHCCDRCPAGKHVKEDCNATKPTVCAECAPGHYTATPNALNKCQVCADCIADNNQVKFKNCTSKENTVCGCKAGFYCINDNCDHCKRVTMCPEGYGVKTAVTRTSDAICMECENGTYSNVEDAFSKCKPHTRCENIGRVEKTPGTSKIDAVCGDFIHHNCPWILPAGLWAGLVLTALILFAVFICWRAKRRSYRAGSTRIPVTLLDMIPPASVKSLDLTLPATSLDLTLPATSLDLTLPATSLDLTFQSTKPNGYCQESCAVEDFTIPLFNKDERNGSCSMGSSLPITPLKASVSFAEPDYIHKSARYSPGNFRRTHSEPQEDEWCGT